jgi:hypothetical protein
MVSHSLADQVRDTVDDPEFACSDLPLLEHEDHTRQLLDGYLLRAYHATRLLPHEADAIRTQGLLILSERLVTDRLDTAHHHGHLTDAERHTLLAGRTLDDNRVDKVCLYLSATTPIRDAHGLRLLLTNWGGEGIYWQHVHNDNPLHTKLRSFGTPTIVVANLDLTAADRVLIFPGVVHALVGTALGLSDIGASIHYYAPIPPTHIERLIQPGDPDYPQHPILPQA